MYVKLYCISLEFAQRYEDYKYKASWASPHDDSPNSKNKNKI